MAEDVQVVVTSETVGITTVIESVNVTTAGQVGPPGATTGGSGTVDSVVAGTGIDVDSTDPENPVVSAEVTPATLASTSASDRAFAVAMGVAL